MTQPPEYDQPRTETQRLADDITTACTTIRRNWPHMLRPGDTQPPGAANRAGIVLHDHDRSDADTSRITRTISLRRFALDQLRAWAQAIIEDRGITTDAVPDGHDVPGLCDFLTRHADWLSGQEYAPDCRDEVHDLAGRCANVAFPKRRESMSLGRCPLEIPDEHDVLETCGGDVRARTSDEAHVDGKVWAVCSRCGEPGPADWWAERMYVDGETSPLVTINELIGVIAYRLQITVTHEQVRQWKARGKIHEAGRDQKGRVLFEHEKVIDAIRSDLRRQAVQTA